MEQVKFSHAQWVGRPERDRNLSLHSDDWPLHPRDGWTKADGHYERIIARDPSEDIRTDLWEGIFRFPSAPIHGLHRLHALQYTENLAEAELFHSFRVLARDSAPGRRPTSVYLLHNGLNESSNMSLYYRLASHLLKDDPQGICIVRPFPGHLTRFPNERFADRPLDRYLADGSHLFRQFMRFMIETQWFLSALVTRSEYWCPSGALLLSGNKVRARSRLSNKVLAHAIAEECQFQHEASVLALRRARELGMVVPTEPKRAAGEQAIEQSISAFRKAIHWDAYTTYGSSRPTGSRVRPAIHVIGYSLGGFTAQSVLMSWPFAVTSCSTLLSGGALRELAPTAFSHPEEWQTVLHSLRYELDHLMSQGFFQETFESEDHHARGQGRIAGVDTRLFLYLQRVFYEIFQQEYRGSYQTRVAEFGRRMLFVVGGSDPIVRAQSLLDSAPPSGLNMIEVARLGHFISKSPKEAGPDAEERRFWLPELAGVFRRFASTAVTRHAEELRECWIGPAVTARSEEVRPHELSELSEEDRFGIEEGGSLPSPLFEQMLDDLTAKVRDGGYLFILRNEIPTALLPEAAVRRVGMALHHDNAGINGFTDGVVGRARSLRESLSRVVLVLPYHADVLAEASDPHGFPSQAETPMGQLPGTVDFPDVWRHVQSMADQLNPRYPGAVRNFRAGALFKSAFGNAREQLYDVAVARSGVKPGDAIVATTLPDCWIWMSKEALDVMEARKEAVSVEDRIAAFCEVAALAFDPKKPRFSDMLEEGKIRIVTVSRARFNPRHRGRLLLDMKAARDVMLHAAVCMLASREGSGLKWTPERGSAAAPATV